MGQVLTGDGVGFGGRDVARLASAARDWFDARVESFRLIVCTDDLISGLGGDLTNDLLTLAPALLPQLDGNELLAFLAAAIILRRGIARFCSLP